MKERFYDIFVEELLIDREELGNVTAVNRYGNPRLKTDLPALTRLDSVHTGIERLYRNQNDGWGIEWETERNSGIGGMMRLADTRHLFAGAEEAGYYSDGINEALKYFQAWDHCSPETCVGFIMTPDEVYSALYYLSGDYELSNLDLDFNGYTQMAVEARVFNNWQLVLLHYMGDDKNNAWAVEMMQAEMPKIFPSWTWDGFIAKFESLRLSRENHDPKQSQL